MAFLTKNSTATRGTSSFASRRRGTAEAEGRQGGDRRSRRYRCGRDPALTGAGAGHLTIIDDDRVELSNLQRQPLYAASQVGERKSDLAARFIGKRNPHVECRTVSDRIEIDNAEAILSDHDLIIDGTDNFATRLLVNDAAVRLEFR